MDATTFLDNFATIAEAPGGVQRLRDLVLDLAVRGRLVEQDPTESSSLRLLATFADQQSPAVPRAPMSGPTSTTRASQTFQTPSGWAWARMRDLHTKMGAGSTPTGGEKVYVDSGIAFLRSQNVWNDGLRLRWVARIPPEIHKRMAGTAVKPGDVLLNITGASIGRSCVVPRDFDQEANVSQHVAILRQADGQTSPWIHLFLISPHGFREIMSGQVGISREGLSMRRLGEFEVPVPPLTEQARILETVDDLMRLCDKLEAHQERCHRAAARFQGSALHALTEAANPTDLRFAWNRVSTNWSTLTENPDNVPALRQTILQLAFEGRLARQNTADSKGSSPHVTGKVLDHPFLVPGHWSWARFDEVAFSRLGKMLDKAKNTGPLRPYLRNANVQWFRFDLSDVHELRLENRDLEAHVVRVGDLVVCEGGEPGRVAVCDDVVDGMVIQKALHRVRPKRGVEVWYLAYLLRCYAGSGFLSSFFTGATIKHLTGRALSSVPVPLPPAREQQRIVSTIDFLMGACDRLERALSIRASTQEAMAVGLVRMM